MTSTLYTVPLHASGPVPEEVIAGAACKGHGDLFFADSRGAKILDEARQICKTCPVKRQCLEYALPITGLFGLWAGLDEQQRGIERRKRGYRDTYHVAKPKPPPTPERRAQPVPPGEDCPSEAQYRSHRRRNEDCETCRLYVSAAVRERRQARGDR